MRHFHMNEDFSNALEAIDAKPSAIRGNAIVTGKLGVFTVGRFNIKAGLWNNGRRSRTRREMSVVNRTVEPLVQPGLFDNAVPITQATAFFVATFGNTEVPMSVDIAVPDKDMKGWLFREPLSVFENRYHTVAAQRDTAIPTLKVQIKVEES
jgi:hypothetical protein